MFIYTYIAHMYTINEYTYMLIVYTCIRTYTLYLFIHKGDGRAVSDHHLLPHALGYYEVDIAYICIYSSICIAYDICLYINMTIYTV